jgi:uncharacterized cupredoxin-like copper-binding protein
MKRLLWLMSVILAFALLITLPTTFTYAAAQFKVSDLSISPTFLIAGSGDSNITVSVKVANIGNESGTYKLELKINDAIETTKDIILDAGKDQTVIFPVTKKDVGEYNVAVENQKGVFNIAPASLDIKTLLIDPPEATPGKEIIISFTVQNKSSDQPLTYDSLKLFINGSVVDKKRIELKPGESTTASFKITKNEPGTYVVNLGTKTASFSVKSSFFDSFTKDPLNIIIGIIVLIIIIMVVMLLAAPKKKKGGLAGKPRGKTKGAGGPQPMPMQGRLGQQGQPYPGQAPQQQPLGSQQMPAQQFPAQFPGQAQPQMPPQGTLPYQGQPQQMSPQSMPPYQGQGQPPQMSQRPMPPPGQPQQQMPAQQFPPQFTGQAKQMPPQGIPPYQGQPQQMPAQKPIQFGAPPVFNPSKPGFAPPSFGMPGRHMPQFTVSTLNITPQQVKEGDPVNISAVATNNTSTTGQYSMVLRISGVVENISELTLNPGSSQTGLFTVIKDSPGEYYVEVDGQRGMFTVIHRLPAAFNVSNLTITPDRVKQGEPVLISAIITNTGETTGNYSVVLRIKGIAESIEEIELEPSRSQKVTFTITKDAAGFFPVALENLTGKFVVEMDWKG